MTSVDIGLLQCYVEDMKTAFKVYHPVGRDSVFTGILATTVLRDAYGIVVPTFCACGRGDAAYSPPSTLKIRMPSLD